MEHTESIKKIIAVMEENGYGLIGTIQHQNSRAKLLYKKAFSFTRIKFDIWIEFSSSYGFYEETYIKFKMSKIIDTEYGIHSSGISFLHIDRIHLIDSDINDNLVYFWVCLLLIGDAILSNKIIIFGNTKLPWRISFSYPNLANVGFVPKNTKTIQIEDDLTVMEPIKAFSFVQDRLMDK